LVAFRRENDGVNVTAARGDDGRPVAVVDQMGVRRPGANTRRCFAAAADNRVVVRQQRLGDAVRVVMATGRCAGRDVAVTWPTTATPGCGA